MKTKWETQPDTSAKPLVRVGQHNRGRICFSKLCLLLHSGFYSSTYNWSPSATTPCCSCLTCCPPGLSGVFFAKVLSRQSALTHSITQPHLDDLHLPLRILSTQLSSLPGFLHRASLFSSMSNHSV